MKRTYEELKHEMNKFHRIEKYSDKKLIFCNEKRISLETDLSKSDEFKSSQLYQDIVDSTDFLPKDATIFHRMKCILKDIHSINKCPICGDNCSLGNEKYSSPMFMNTCGKPYCKSKKAWLNVKITESTRKKHSNIMKDRKNNYNENYNNLIQRFWKNDFTLLPKNTLKEFFQMKIDNQFKNGSIIKENDFIINVDFICSLLRYTENISDLEVPSEIHSKQDFKFNERMYCLINDIKVRPVCKFCNGHVKFWSLTKGYYSSCGDCGGDKFREKIGYPTLSEIKESIDTEKYEIISFPKKTDTEKLIVKCKKCGWISEHFIYNGIGKKIKDLPLCKNCEKYSSKEEYALRHFLMNNYNKTILINDRLIISPLELDIYLPENKLAIEFDGLHWHSFKKDFPLCRNNNKDYHKMKTIYCLEKGIQLIHIFEDEWLFKQDIVKSRLRNFLGIYDQKIYARKCQILEIDKEISRQFQENNHIQGAVTSKVNLGLYFEDELVSLMTFSKPRFNKKYDWELVRFCNKLNYHIPGAASKLLTFFERNYKPRNLLSYADRRWSKGNLYEKLGFKLDHISSPDYWYVTPKYLIRESRLKYQKHKLPQLLEHFDPSKTEVQNMLENGYEQVFDCGNLVYVKTY